MLRLSLLLLATLVATVSGASFSRVLQQQRSCTDGESAACPPFLTEQLGTSSLCKVPPKGSSCQRQGAIDTSGQCTE